ncbi:MAG: hypothetical protein IPI60_02080 [Saprospiraceae bacterium]|nr:hypothetical protein [Saprospiraceae bacterium]
MNFGAGNPPAGTRWVHEMSFIAPTTSTYTFDFSADYFGVIVPMFGPTSNMWIDGLAMIYAGSFNPANPCQNLVGGGDDGAAIVGFGALQPLFDINLVAGQSYVLVYTSWGALNPAGLGDFYYQFNVTPPIFLSDLIAQECTIGCTEIAQLQAATTLAQLTALGINEPTVTDNCGLAGGVTFTVSAVSSSDVCDDRFLTITYSATDVCGNTATCERQVLVENDVLETVCGNLRNYDNLDLEGFECDE